jgi:hypothetical protein
MGKPTFCVKIFVVRFISGAQQMSFLPCIFIGRMPNKKRTTKILFAVPYKKRSAKVSFAMCFLHRAWQSIFLPLHTTNKPNVIIFKILRCAH